jgi:hypothetical protein
MGRVMVGTSGGTAFLLIHPTSRIFFVNWSIPERFFVSIFFFFVGRFLRARGSPAGGIPEDITRRAGAAWTDRPFFFVSSTPGAKGQVPFQCRTALQYRPRQEYVLSQHLFGSSADRRQR